MKSKICQHALNHINAYEDLSKEAIMLCDKIYQFIAYNHSREIENYSKICEKLNILPTFVKFDEVEELQVN